MLSAVKSFARSHAMILIYHDRGVCELSAAALEQELGRCFRHIQRVDSAYLKTASWESSAGALVMGGGCCTSWEEQLQTAGMQKIHNFVCRGGKFVGFCAGAYFTASHSLFHLAGSPILEKKRPLRFFEGKAIGPLFSTEEPLSLASARAIPLIFGSQKGNCYYQGGCYFDIEEDTAETKILARYAPPYQGAAMIRCGPALYADSTRNFPGSGGG